MINSAIDAAVRHAVMTTALAAALSLLPATTAHAEQSDRDNDVEKVELFGVNLVDTTPEQIDAGDSWVTRTKLYTVTKGNGEGKGKVVYAGTGESECGAVQVSHGEVTAQCTRVLRLKQGRLTLSDMITSNPPERVTAKTSVVGGTGHYKSAYGEGYITLDDRHVHLELDVEE